MAIAQAQVALGKRGAAEATLSALAYTQCGVLDSDQIAYSCLYAANALRILDAREQARAVAEAVARWAESPDPNAKIAQSWRKLVAAATHFVVGDCSQARRAIDEAIEATRSLAENSYPDTLSTLHVSAALLYEMGDVAAARAAVWTMVEHFERKPPDKVDFLGLLTMASLLIELGEGRAAERMLSAVADNTKASYSFFVLAGMIHYGLGDRVRARFSFSRAAEGFRAGEWPAAARDLIRLAGMQADFGDPLGARQNLLWARTGLEPVTSPPEPKPLP